MAAALCDKKLSMHTHSPGVPVWPASSRCIIPYEQVLQRELDGLDDEFNTLKFLAQELQVRANSIRFQKAA